MRAYPSPAASAVAHSPFLLGGRLRNDDISPKRHFFLLLSGRKSCKASPLCPERCCPSLDMDLGYAEQKLLLRTANINLHVSNHTTSLKQPCSQLGQEGNPRAEKNNSLGSFRPSTNLKVRQHPLLYGTQETKRASIFSQFPRHLPCQRKGCFYP